MTEAESHGLRKRAWTSFLHGTVVLSVGQPVAVTAVFCFCVVHRMPYVQKLQQDCCRFELACSECGLMMHACSLVLSACVVLADSGDACSSHSHLMEAVVHSGCTASRACALPVALRSSRAAALRSGWVWRQGWSVRQQVFVSVREHQKL